jgi:hypothetical protein
MPRKRRRPAYRKPDLTVAQILAWADDHKRRTGRWPNHASGRIKPLDETWLAINMALARGNRGLPGGSSLAKVLDQHRGVRNLKDLPRLTEGQIMRWAKAQFDRTAKWPHLHSGAIRDAPGESWYAIDVALKKGTRGLPGKSSLARLLADKGVQNNLRGQPRLTPRQLLAWADAYFHRHDLWPDRSSGQIVEAPLETWMGIDRALRYGRRGLPGELSLPKFLNKHRNLFKGKSRRPKTIQESQRLRVDKVVAWGKEHFCRTGDGRTATRDPFVASTG